MQLILFEQDLVQGNIEEEEEVEVEIPVLGDDEEFANELSEFSNELSDSYSPDDLDEDAVILDEDTITPYNIGEQDPNETIRASEYPQSNALELTSVLISGGISMAETRNTLKKIRKPRQRLLSVEQDLAQDLSFQLNIIQHTTSPEPSLQKRRSI
jgi:hypothetical protein